MKAKEYAEQFRQYLRDPLYYDNAEKSLHKAIEHIINDFLTDYRELSKARGMNSTAAALSCFNEINDKYKAFTRLVDDGKFLKPDGFEIILRREYPVLWDCIETMRAQERQYAHNVPR